MSAPKDTAPPSGRPTALASEGPHSRSRGAPRRKRQRASDVDDAWLRGYASALVSVYQRQADAQLVRELMKQDGVTIDSIVAAGALDRDIEVLRRCVEEKKA